MMVCHQSRRCAEVKKAEEYLAKKNGEKAAWEDMVWALLNTKEFLFNH